MRSETKQESPPLFHQKRRHRVTERNHRKVQASEGKILLEKEERFRAEMSLRGKCNESVMQLLAPSLVSQLQV